MLKEFKKFISRGNVMDLAVGVIIGGAFSSIVTSLVDNIITPLLGIILGGIDFSGLQFTVLSATVHYGVFIQNVVNFLLTAFCLFLIVKGLNKFEKALAKNKEKQEEDKKEEVKKEEIPTDVKLLTEIRDLLRKNEKAGE
ncbi:MAG: large conductance mechanosensitive channel protein MscL [Eubacteriaceae bacterium]|nr:large conductance mechanosensitive channel protein MscL [Eubacteriaceae bacterium]